MRFGVRGTLPDPDPVATQEWIDSILAVRDQIGEEEARRLLLSTVGAAKDAGVEIDVVNTPYMNTIHPDSQGAYPGDLDLETRLHGIIRWNAMMVVTRGNKYFEGIGGHISTYASASHAWEIGFNHFFRGKDGAGQGEHAKEVLSPPQRVGAPLPPGGGDVAYGAYTHACMRQENMNHGQAYCGCYSGPSNSDMIAASNGPICTFVYVRAYAACNGRGVA